MICSSMISNVFNHPVDFTNIQSNENTTRIRYTMDIALVMQMSYKNYSFMGDQLILR